MNEVLQFTIPVNGHISIENREIIDHILANFATFCHSQSEKQAIVRSQVNTFRGKSPETDIVTNIPFVALARYLPKTNHFESKVIHFDPSHNISNHNLSLIRALEVHLVSTVSNKDISKEK